MIEFCIRNPVKVSVGVIAIALFGSIALWQIPIQLTPEVKTPTISVSVRWPGASPYEIEHEIVQELEDQLAARTAEYEEKLNAARTEMAELRSSRRVTALSEADTLVKGALEVLPPAVKRGQRMSVALEGTDTFSPLVVQMVRVGEESGSLDQMMIELADVYDEEVQAGVKRALALLEPALILVMGGSIAVIIIAILSGILSVNDLAF